MNNKDIVDMYDYAKYLYIKRKKYKYEAMWNHNEVMKELESEKIDEKLNKLLN